jgi:hypothetical protein
MYRRFLLMVVATFPAMAFAQGIDPQMREIAGDPMISVHQNWAVFQAADESLCYAATLADDRKTYLRIADRQTEGGGGHVVSLLFSEPARRGAEAMLTVDGGQNFTMGSTETGAWFTNGEIEEQARQAIMRGGRAEVAYILADDTSARIAFSLRGATAATRAARETCR